MNMISFGNFDNFDKTAGFPTDPAAADPAQDFSAILNNISEMMQSAGLPSGTESSGEAAKEFQFAPETFADQPTGIDPSSAAVKPLETPKTETKSPLPLNVPATDDLPSDPALWAGIESSNRQQWSKPKEVIEDQTGKFEKYPIPSKTDCDPKAQIKMLFDSVEASRTENVDQIPIELKAPAEIQPENKSNGNPMDAIKKLFQAEPGQTPDIIVRPEKTDEMPLPAEPTTKQETIEPPPIIQIEPGQTPPILPTTTAPIKTKNTKAEKPSTLDPKVLPDKPTIEPPPIIVPPEVKPVPAETQTPPIILLPDTKPLPAETKPETKTETPPIIVYPNPDTVPTNPKFETPPIIVTEAKFEKPVRFQPTLRTSPKIDAQTPPFNPSENATIADAESSQAIHVELPETIATSPATVRSETSRTVEISFENQTPPLKFETEQIENPAETQADLPKITLKPLFDGGKIEGFNLTPIEINSILKGFDSFFKKAETAQKADLPENPEIVPVLSETFKEISESIKENVNTELKNAEPIAQTNLAEEFQKPDDFIRTAVLTAVENKSTKRTNDANKPEFDVEPAVGNSDSDVDAQASIINFNKTETPVAAKIDFQPAKQVAVNQKTAESDVNPVIEGVSSAAKTFGLREDQQPGFQIRAEKPKPEVGDQEADLAVRFDKFLSNITKERSAGETGARQDVNQQKVFEQINPQLIELAANVQKKNEKQTLKMRLHPAELGAVEIRLEKNSAGTLNAYFKTETEGARQALTQNLEQLRDSLQNAGWQIGQLEISSGSGQSTADQHRENPSRQSEPFDNFNFNRQSEKPDDTDQNQANRLLNLLA